MMNATENTKMKFKQDNRAVFEAVLREFGSAVRAEYDYAYEAGYLQSLAVQMLGYMPRRHQQMFIDDMRRAHKNAVERAAVAKEPQA
jgi:hypothetical protein